MTADLANAEVNPWRGAEAQRDLARFPERPKPPAEHRVASVVFGLGRLTTCSCGVAVTGRTDEAMSTAFGQHVFYSHHPEREPGPVTRQAS